MPKITPSKLVKAANAINNLLDVNTNTEFNVLARRFLFEVNSELEFWNSLSKEERTLIKDKEIDIPFNKLEEVPKYYPNSAVSDLNVIYQKPLEEKKPLMKSLMDQTVKENE